MEQNRTTILMDQCAIYTQPFHVNDGKGGKKEKIHRKIITFMYVTAPATTSIYFGT